MEEEIGDVKGHVGDGMINTTKETCHLLGGILTAVSHFELSNGWQLHYCFDDLGHIRFLRRHIRASVHDREASND